jgi:hypothetical protein
MASEGLAALIHETIASKEDIKELRAEWAGLRGETKAGFGRLEHILTSYPLQPNPKFILTSVSIMI